SPGDPPRRGRLWPPPTVPGPALRRTSKGRPRRMSLRRHPPLPPGHAGASPAPDQHLAALEGDVAGGRKASTSRAWGARPGPSGRSMSNITERLRGHFELQNGTSRNLAMEGLRGIAVTLVFLVHYHSVLTPWMAGVEGWGSDFGRAMRFAGAAGVDLFFVLSGYLIYGATLSARFSWGGFMRRRLQRIYPTFLVLLTIYLGLSFLIPSESKLPPGAAEASFYVLQNVLLLPGMFAIKPIITVAWSLSYEMFFYL